MKMRRGALGIWPSDEGALEGLGELDGLVGEGGSLPGGALVATAFPFESARRAGDAMLSQGTLFGAELRPLLERPLSLMVALSGMGAAELRVVLERDASLDVERLAPHELHNLQNAVAQALRARCAGRIARKTSIESVPTRPDLSAGRQKGQ